MKRNTVVPLTLLPSAAASKNIPPFAVTILSTSIIRSGVYLEHSISFFPVRLGNTIIPHGLHYTKFR